MILEDILKAYSDTDYFWDYQPLLNLIGDIIIQEDEQDYSGDSYILYRKDDLYGYLNFGWGSCSGCDALQACTSIEEVFSLAQELENDVFWGTLPEVKEYVNSRTSDYYYNDSTFKIFKTRVNNYVD